MSAYIIEIPDGHVDEDATMYYPDERHAPMLIERIVRCKDCIRSKPSEYWEGLYDCRFTQISMPPDGFCSEGERREA